jgi:hypothetical protein
VLASQGQKYKWLTADGQTIFRPTPPEDPGQPYCQRLNDGPWTCFSGADTLEEPPPDPALTTEEDRQRQQDLLLRTRYRSLADIDTQLQEELDQVSFQRNVALSNQRMQETQLFQSIATAADRQRAGLEVEQEQLNAVQQARENLRMTQDALALIELEDSRVRARFEERKIRYRQLMEQYASP